MRPVVSDYNNNGLGVTVDWIRLTPYANSGSYESAVFGSGALTAWQEIAWSSDKPVGTTIAVYTRTGDTVVPGVTWSPWALVPASGSLIGGNSIYVQFRADLTTSDPELTPTLRDLSIWCEEGSDITPPVISDLAAAPDPAGTTALVTWTTNEPADSRVDYGTAPGNLDETVLAANLVMAHAMTLTGLSPGQTYHYRVTSADAAANFTAAPTGAPDTFTTPLQPCAVLSTVANFAAGTRTGTYLAQTGDGEVILAPTEGVEFDGTGLPAGWTSNTWDPAGSVVVTGGTLTVDGAMARGTTTYAPGSSLEFTATFAAYDGTGNNKHEHIGFASSTDPLNVAPWAIFSTGWTGATLQARVWAGGPFMDVPLPGSYLGVSHRYRIDWNADGFDFLVDGAPVHHEPTTIASPMVVAASDLHPNTAKLALDWARVAPYNASGSYESPILDAGADGSSWHEIVWHATTPAATALGIRVRGGNTAVPDGNWSLYAPATSGSDLALVARYLQFEAQLATTDPFVSPSLADLSVTCGCCEAAANIIRVDTSAIPYISTAVPCAADVPIVIERADATPVRGYSVTLALEPELALCGSAAASITEGSYLTGFGQGTLFQVTDHADGTYTVDCAIQGSPCGATDPSGSLFTVDLAGAVAEGVGTVTVLATNLRLRDCDNVLLDVEPGAPASIAIDMVAPAPVTAIAAQQVAADNPPGKTMQVRLTWTASTAPDRAQTLVYRKGFGHYPEYDDLGGSEPTLATNATPAQAVAAGWTFATQTTFETATDLTTGRDVWSYVTFVVDTHGNVSWPSTLTAGLPNYFLGDVSDGVAPEGETLPGDGDNKVDGLDISLLGTHYGTTITHLDPLARLDVGPCVGHPVRGRPQTDNAIEFEDLILFGINYGHDASQQRQLPLVYATPDPAPANELTVVVPPLPPVGETFAVLVAMNADGQIQGLSVALDWDETIVAPIGVEPGELLAAQGGLAVVLPPRAGVVDVSLLGIRERGLAGEGVVASLTFQVVGTATRDSPWARSGHARRTTNRSS